MLNDMLESPERDGSYRGPERTKQYRHTLRLLVRAPSDLLILFCIF